MSEVEVGPQGVENTAMAEMLDNGEYDSSNPPDLDSLFDTPEELEAMAEEPQEEDLQEDEVVEDEDEYEYGDDDTEYEEEEGDMPIFSGEDIEAFSQEYAELGGLSQETVDNLVQVGLPESLIDTYLQGLGAIQQMQEQQAFASVGGEESYNELMTWAGTNLGDAEIDAFNSSVNNPAQFQLALQGLKSRYENSYGSSQSGTIYGNQGGGAGNDLFQSTAEVVSAMNDKRYGSDTSYAKMIEAKVRRSNVFG